jgi:hypothetical protein
MTVVQAETFSVVCINIVLLEGYIYFEFQLFHVKEEFEDTKGIIGIRKSKKNR